MSSPTGPLDADALDRQAEQAAREAQQMRERAAAARQQQEQRLQAREREFRAARLQAWTETGRTADRQAVRDAEVRFAEAVRQDPVLSAFVEREAQRFRAFRHIERANSDAQELGRPEPARGVLPPLLQQLPEALQQEVGVRLQETIEGLSAAEDQAFTDYATGGAAPQTPEQQLAYEAERDAQHRARMATPTRPTSVNVEGMTDAERERRGLPRGGGR